MRIMEKESSRKHFFPTIVYLILLIIIVGTVYLLDGSHDYSIGQNENAMKFGVSFMTMNNPFFEVIDESIKATVEANGDIVMTRDPALDSNRQIAQIREMIDEGVDGLFICPVDFDKILPVIKEAREKGVIIVIVDTPIYDESLADVMVVSDNYLAGSLCAEYLMKQKDSAKILILEHTRVKSANDRVAGFLDALDKNHNYEIVARDDCEGQLEISMPHTKQLIDEECDFDTIFAINDLSALGAMAALEDSGKLKSIDVLGVDGSPEAKAMIKENIMLATAAQYPSMLGEKAVEQMYNLCFGRPYEKKILVEVDLISKENVNEFGTGSWQ